MLTALLSTEENANNLFQLLWKSDLIKRLFRNITLGAPRSASRADTADLQLKEKALMVPSITEYAAKEHRLI